MLDLDKILELSIGVDEALRRTLAFSEMLKEIKVSLDKLKETAESRVAHEVQKLRDEVSALRQQLKYSGNANINQYEVEFEELKRLIEDDSWPVAVPPAAICTTPEQQNLRAETILDMVVGESLKDQTFLDFGCGFGHVTEVSSKRGTKMSVGYDIEPQWVFHEGKPNMFFTSNWEEAVQQSPYNVILMFDLLDHVKNASPVDVLKQARSVLSDAGKIYVRCHPWCARHGGHLYQRKNKAYLHLVMDEIELTRLAGIESDHNLKILRPIGNDSRYRQWFNEAGLDILSEIPMKKTPEEFFTKHSIVRDKIEKNWGVGSVENLENYLAIEFVDFVVQKKPEVSQKKIF